MMKIGELGTLGFQGLDFQGFWGLSSWQGFGLEVEGAELTDQD